MHIAYYRVSTPKQGKSGLGLEAQMAAVASYAPIKSFTEVETGKRSDRPELAKAMAACRLYGATLVIAKIDRLSRNAHFLLGLKEAGIEFIAADMPTANRLTVGIMAMVAEEEGRMISKRTTEALAAAKARGVRLGGVRYRPDGTQAIITPDGRKASVRTRQSRAAARAAQLAPVIAELRRNGAVSLRELARGLNRSQIPTAWGKAEWSASQVKRVLLD
jgi:DNA invertase Pin-like site-specific DNA recombinase